MFVGHHTASRIHTAWLLHRIELKSGATAAVRFSFPNMNHNESPVSLPPPAHRSIVTAPVVLASVIVAVFPFFMRNLPSRFVCRGIGGGGGGGGPPGQPVKSHPFQPNDGRWLAGGRWATRLRISSGEAVGARSSVGGSNCTNRKGREKEISHLRRKQVTQGLSHIVGDFSRAHSLPSACRRC